MAIVGLAIIPTACSADRIDVAPLCDNEGGLHGLKIGRQTVDQLNAPDMEKRIESALGSAKSVHIAGDMTLPYRCIGGAIFALQRAGIRNVGFTAEPAASP